MHPSQEGAAPLTERARHVLEARVSVTQENQTLPLDTRLYKEQECLTHERRCLGRVPCHSHLPFH